MQIEAIARRLIHNQTHSRSDSPAFKISYSGRSSSVSSSVRIVYPATHVGTPPRTVRGPVGLATEEDVHNS
eukprot:1393320-Pyramimonas_sp.AAC.1